MRIVFVVYPQYSQDPRSGQFMQIVTVRAL